MKIYLAARYGRHAEMREYAASLVALGHTVTSRWILGDHELRAGGHAEEDPWHEQWALEDVADLQRADMCVSFTESPNPSPGRNRGGRHVEHGIAFATGKACVVIGYRENVFHWLSAVQFYRTWDDFYQGLTQATEGREEGL